MKNKNMLVVLFNLEDGLLPCYLKEDENLIFIEDTINGLQ